MTIKEAQRLGLCCQCGAKGTKRYDPDCLYDRGDSLDYRQVGKGNCPLNEVEMAEIRRGMKSQELTRARRKK